MNEIDELIEIKLMAILSELEQQHTVGEKYSENSLSYREEMEQIREFIDLAGEYTLAYEIIVATLEKHPFFLSSKAAVNLLEIGLFMQYKTDREEDKIFDIRNKNPR
jgi:hypothetical protein